MTSRGANVAIVLFWLATMSWLVVEKILPPMLIGEPPTYATIVRDQRQSDDDDVTWEMYWNDRPVGWARTTVERQSDDATEIRNNVHFDQLPLDEVSPFARLLSDEARLLELEAISTVEIDPLGRLIGFSSEIGVGGLPDLVRMRGTVDGSQLGIEVRWGTTFKYQERMYLPQDALVGDALSPQARLPNLRAGQQWTVPVYSPFQPKSEPMQILTATVERRDAIIWGGDSVRTWLVVYRSDRGAARSFSNLEHGRVWVRDDGTVIKQELRVLQSVLRFVRVPLEQKAVIVDPQSTR